MATIVLDVQDESLVAQIKKACQLLKGVASVKVQRKPKPRVGNETVTNCYQLKFKAPDGKMRKLDRQAFFPALSRASRSK